MLFPTFFKSLQHLSVSCTGNFIDAVAAETHISASSVKCKMAATKCKMAALVPHISKG